MAKRQIIKIKDGWEDAGRHGEQLGDPIEVNGMSWTPVLFQNEEDPDFYKTAGLELAFNR